MTPDDQEGRPSVEGSEPPLLDVALTPALGPLPSVVVEVPRGQDDARRDAAGFRSTTKETRDAQRPR